MLGHGLYSTFCDKENNQFLIRVYMSIFSDKKEKTSIITPAKNYSLSYRLRSIDWNEDFYFENPDGVELAGYAFDYYSCFPAFKPNIYLHSNSTLAANWADDLNKGADEGKNHTTADFNLI